jgi:hypothetical protein
VQCNQNQYYIIYNKPFSFSSLSSSNKQKQLAASATEAGFNIHSHTLVSCFAITKSSTVPLKVESFFLKDLES